MDGEHLRTPSRTTFARRLCSTPIRTSEAVDDEVADGDVSSFLSTLDEFVEQCDSFLPAHRQASVEDDAADICAEGLEYASGNVRSSSVCFTGCDEGQSLPKHECTTRRGSYAHDDKIGPQDADEVIALSSEDECIESVESDQYTPVSQQSGSSSAMACKGSVEDGDETLTLSSEDECTEAIRLEQYASDPQHSGCSSVKVQCRKPDFVDILEDSHYYQNTEHVQGSESNNDCMTPEHDTNYVILEELNCENSLSPSRNDRLHPNSREQEHMHVSQESTARTKENQCKHQEQSYHGNCKNVMLNSYGVHRQELEPGELSHRNVTHTEGANETRRCSEASCRNEGNDPYKFNSSCQMQNACTFRCAYFSEKPEEQQSEQYTQSFNKSCAMEDTSTFKDYKDEPLEPESFDDFNKSCVMEDASTFKDYEDEPLEPGSFDDSCIMEDASALKEYGEAERVDAGHVKERYNESCVMEDASAFIRHGKATEKELASQDSPCSTHERKESRLPAEHLMTTHDRGSNKYVVQCSTNCAPQKVFASDQKQVCGFKDEWSNVYAQNSSLQSSAVGVCNKSYTGKERMSCIMPYQQQVNQVSKADTTSESSRISSPSEAATRESDITAAKPSADQKNEHHSSVQEPAVSCESASSNLILKQHLEVNASANSPAYFTDVVQSVPDICARSSFCHEDTVERIPGLEEPNRPTGLSAHGDDHAYSSSSQEQELKGNSIMSGAEICGKIEVPAPVRLKDNHDEVDIVPAVDKECKGTSHEVCSSSKAAFHSDAHLGSNGICDTADIFETTLVAEADLNIASSAERCTSTGISHPSLASTVASGDTLDLGVETDNTLIASRLSLSSTVASGGTLDLGVETDNTLIAEAQSSLASAKSTEHCLPMQLPTDVPKSGSVTSGDTLDLGVESDDMFVAEVQSPVASEKFAKCCQPTSETANASTHDVLGQCADMLGCMLPQDFSVPSADTRRLAVDSPAHPLLASTSSEDELHIPEDLDMREKLKLIRAQQERHFRPLHEPEDQHAHVNNTVPTDIKGLEPHLPIAKAPEVKNKAPFMSEDPDENMDNENPEWEAVRSLTTDEERYQAVQKVWHNIRIPDPHKELSTFNYRRHTLSMKHSKNPPSSKPKRRKRKASHNSQHEHTKPVKRQRFDTDIIDLKLKELKRKREKDVTKAQKMFRDDIRELHMTLMRTSQEMHASHDHGHSSKHHRRAHTTPWDFRYYLSQEQRICEEFKANEESIQSNYMAKEHKLLSARNEVRCVDDFYAGLRDKDPRLLSDKQVREHLKREEMLGYFKVVYKTPKE